MSFRDLLPSDDFHQDFLGHQFQSFANFANFVIEDLNRYLSWFFKAPESANFFPEQGRFLTEHVQAVWEEHLPRDLVEEDNDRKTDEMMLSPHQSPKVHNEPIFFPLSFGEHQEEKANHSRVEDYRGNEEDGGPAKRVIVEVAALDQRPQLPMMSQNLSQSNLYLQTLQSSGSEPGGRRFRHLTR